jgi:outer membrane protein
MRLNNIFAGTVICLCLGMNQAQAQVSTDIIDNVTDSIGDITDILFPGISNIRLGLGPAISPRYEGSERYKIKATPLISLRYKDLVTVDNNNVRVNMFGLNSSVKSSRFKAGPEFRIARGRKEKKDPDLAGLGNTGTSVELGVFGSYTLGPARTRLRFFHDVANGHNGTRVIGDIRYVMLESDDIVLTGSITSTWADNNYIDTFFSVNSAQSLASGLPVFNAGSGIKDAGIGIVANYKISERWAVLANTNYKRLLGDAADSPLVSLRGSANQFSGAVFVIYSFGVKKQSTTEGTGSQPK